MKNPFKWSIVYIYAHNDDELLLSEKYTACLKLQCVNFCLNKKNQMQLTKHSILNIVRNLTQSLTELLLFLFYFAVGHYK